MKKFIAVLLSLSMALALAAAGADTYTVDAHYTVEYPDTMALDDTAHADESTQNNVWLFMLEGEGFLIDAYLTTLENYDPDFSLSAAGEAGIQAYLDEVTEAFSDRSPEAAGSVITDGGIPFYIFRLTDADGPYLYAETIENGVGVNFICYYVDGVTEPDEALLGTLEALLQTFTPARDE
jgi:hypothetical protein